MNDQEIDNILKLNITKGDIVLFRMHLNKTIDHNNISEKNTLIRLSEIIELYHLYGKPETYIINKKFEIEDIFFMSSIYSYIEPYIDLYNYFLSYSRDLKISKLC